MNLGAGRRPDLGTECFRQVIFPLPSAILSTVREIQVANLTRRERAATACEGRAEPSPGSGLDALRERVVEALSPTEAPSADLLRWRWGLAERCAESPHDSLPWAWVDERFAAAGTYWVTAVNTGNPHPRPVRGWWDHELLHLSIGTPATRPAVEDDPRVTVHLESGTDVVIVEGWGTGRTAAPEVVAGYDAKYRYRYDVDTFGPLTTVRAETVLAWQAAGPAGRDGFVATGRWRLGR